MTKERDIVSKSKEQKEKHLAAIYRENEKLNKRLELLEKSTGQKLEKENDASILNFKLSTQEERPLEQKHLLRPLRSKEEFDPKKMTLEITHLKTQVTQL